MTSGFHVHGPHDHELEHAAQHEPQGMAGQLAVITAILATLGAFSSYMGGATQAEAALDKNDAAIRKTEESDQWNFYQAKANKANLSELKSLVATDPAQKQHFLDEAARYKSEQEAIKQKAEALEKAYEEDNQKSEAQMHQHHRWAQATTLLQVSIALAAIALLTKKRWLEWGTLGVAALGIATGVAAWFHL
jgi:flagellar biosynthesis GTPase FlhF